MAGSVVVAKYISSDDDFGRLAKALGCSVSKARDLWLTSKVLDGDERFSLADAYGLTWTGPGRPATHELERGLGKLQKALKRPQRPKSKTHKR